MIIARIIRCDCNLIKFGKDWLPLKKTPQTTLITEYCIHRMVEDDIHRMLE